MTGTSTLIRSQPCDWGWHDEMQYVALKMLFGDRAKYLMLLCGLSFPVMLIVQQGSIFLGLMIWSQSGISNVNVEIWVTDPNISQVEEIKPIADTAVERVRTVPGVGWAVLLYKGVLRARLSNGEYHRISVVGLDGGGDPQVFGEFILNSEKAIFFIPGLSLFLKPSLGL
jgi:hypothetical protein